jgi:hypothetical protein
MCKKLILLLIINFFVCNICSIAQNVVDTFSLKNGITVEYNKGSEIIYDNYISKENYSGSLNSIAIYWLRENKNCFSRLGIDYQSASLIHNYNVNADAICLDISRDILYNINRKYHSGKKRYLFIGPSIDFFLYFRRQNIANGGLTGFLNVYSFSSLFSGNFNIELYQPINNHFYISGGIKISIISVGMRMFNLLQANNQSPIHILDPLSGVNDRLNFDTQYKVKHWVVGVGYSYKIHALKHEDWESFYMQKNMFRLNITYTL